jgi:branched-chain amino acid aminotransferase
MGLSIQVEKIKQSKLPNVQWDNLIFGRTFSDHMFIADFSDGEWQNMRIEPYGPMTVDPSISAIHYGQSIFEGLKAFKTEDNRVLLFRPEANAKRLNRSAERMCMANLPEEIFMEGLKQLLQIDREWISSRPGYSLYIRPFMFATENYLGIKPSDSYRFMIITSPVGAYYDGAIAVKVETKFSRAAPGGTGQAKAAGNYAASLYPARLAQQEGYRQLVWTDAKEHAYIEESGTMNLFAVINGILHTPPLQSETILPGITRDSILTIARSWGMEVAEAPFSVQELKDGISNGSLTELFGAGTAATIAQIEKIHILGNDFILPEVSDRPFSNKVSNYLNDLKRGIEADPFGWITEI